MAYNIFLHVLLMFLYSFQFLFLYSVILTEYNAIEPGVCVCIFRLKLNQYIQSIENATRSLKAM